MSPSRSAGIALIAALGIVLTASPSTASADVVVSSDGTLYTHEISGLLDRGVLVPLETATDSFSVRSEAGTPGYLRVLLSDVTSSDPALQGALSVAVATADAAGSAIPLTSAEPCAQLLTAVPLRPGQSVTVNTSLAMGDLSGREGQGARFSFLLQVVLSDEIQDSDACAGASGGDSGRGLSPTGGTIPVLAIAAGVAAVATGAAAVAGARKRRAVR
ncbi:hypothetical protein QL996_12615 [Planococcus sp. APC 4015]|nr:hypothetical protein [Planococcus sp. APC 4015]